VFETWNSSGAWGWVFEVSLSGWVRRGWNVDCSLGQQTKRAAKAVWGLAGFAALKTSTRVRNEDRI